MQPGQLPYWVQILQALGPTFVTLVVGAIAALLTYWQFKTARDKLRLDLFEKRFKVYSAYFRTHAAVLGHWPNRNDVVAEFAALKGEARFLFDAPASDFIDAAVLEFAGLTSHQDMQREMRRDGQHDEQLGRTIISLLERIEARERIANETFEKYLSFSKIRGR
ncbi:MAG: hypothetical protein HYX37_02750 [Rhizobiales bacterium]|nr:hypothetical protein [Hyphomicrobiales bacterium]